MWLTTLSRNMMKYYCHFIAFLFSGRATPQSGNGQLAFLLVGHVRTLEDHSRDARSTETLIAEVHYHPERKIHQFHIREALRLMARHIHLIFIKSLRFYHKASVDQNINTKFFLELISLVAYRDNNFLLRSMSAKLKLSGQTFLIKCFRQSNT